MEAFARINPRRPAVRERPILFSAPMVRALLAGTKTKTRRVVKYQAPDLVDDDGWPLVDRSIDGIGEVRGACPYGQPGDRLWVREAWRIGAWREDDQQIAVDFCDGPDKSWRQVPLTPEGQELFDRLWIQSSDECRRKGVHPNADGNYRWSPGESPLRWRPSIHMPRWASRITLEVTGVRVERLQDISEADATAEGVSAIPDEMRRATPRCDFQALWQSINGPDSWAANPWVWIVEFRRIES